MAITTEASERFDRWTRSTGLPRKQIAVMLDCDPSYVTKLASGDVTPGLRLAVAIEKASARWKSGPIRPAEWVAARRAA